MCLKKSNDPVPAQFLKAPWHTSWKHASSWKSSPNKDEHYSLLALKPTAFPLKIQWLENEFLFWDSTNFHMFLLYRSFAIFKETKKHLSNHPIIWMFPKIMVPPKSSILMEFSTINHPFWDTPNFWKHPYRTTLLGTDEFRVAEIFWQAIVSLAWRSEEVKNFQWQTGHVFFDMCDQIGCWIPHKCIYIYVYICVNVFIYFKINIYVCRYMYVNIYICV